MLIDTPNTENGIKWCEHAILWEFEVFEDCGNCIAMEQSGYISIVKTGSKEQKNKMQGVEIMNKKEIKLSNGMEMPRLGMGTWFLGENRSKDAEETAALRAGIDAGIRLIDTAEMYGDGRS